MKSFNLKLTLFTFVSFCLWASSITTVPVLAGPQTTLTSSTSQTSTENLNENDELELNGLNKLSDKRKNISRGRHHKSNSATSFNTIIVQPVILCNDDGTMPARHALPKKLITQAYQKANLHFFYLPTVQWKNTQAKQGSINLNTIVKQGRKQGIIASDPHILTLLFVSSVDGHQGSLGRGLQGGNICFICLGPDGSMQSPAKQAFVVAHEIGHCLGLKHVIDDPKVPNDQPNLQGEGSFEDRIASRSLHPSQVETIRASKLCISPIHFLSRQEASDQIIHDAWNNNPQALRDNEICFQLGLPSDTTIPQAPHKRKTFIQNQFRQMTEDFTKEEKKTLTRSVKQLNHLLETSPLFGGKNNSLTQIPWRFIKVKSQFCMGFPHTRGLNIVLTGSVIKGIQKNNKRGLSLLLHEKTHILQRIQSQHFAPSYHRYGFTPAHLAKREANRLKILTNPDATPPHWAITIKDNHYLIATSLEKKDKHFSFNEYIYPLKTTPHGNIALTHTKKTPPEIITWKKQFPIPTGFDDPREIQAYLFSVIFENAQHPQASRYNTFSEIQKKTLLEEESHLPQLLIPTRR